MRWVPTGVLIGLLAWSSARARGDDLGSAVYVRSDTDTTTVVSPRARAKLTLGESTDLDAVYAVDIWTSASVDVRTSASVNRVTEQRDELDVTVTHALSDLTLHAGYRLSIENDYDSNGLSLGGAYDLANNAATLALSINGIHDVVGRSVDPQFARRLDTLNTRLSFTQVIDPTMFVQLTYELALLDGYQASPYRYVGIMGTGFGCEGASLCLPERVPNSRMRHAFALTARRALGDALSLGSTYRYYLDDWSLSSHTVLADLAWNPSDDVMVGLEYRFYRQTAAEFYQARYREVPSEDDYLTHDRELSALSAHRLELRLQSRHAFDNDEKRLTTSLAVAAATFLYDHFVGLTSVQALEVTAALLVTL